MRSVSQTGLSLIELMIVLLIVSLLSLLAYPSYAQFVKKTRRLEAKLALFDLAGRMEQYAAENAQSYTGATLPSLGVAPITEKKGYQLRLEEVSKSHYTLVATPTFKDPVCKKFIYKQSGECLHEGSGTQAECWGV